MSFQLLYQACKSTRRSDGLYSLSLCSQLT